MPAKGCHHTSKAKEKIRLSKMGNKNPAKRPEVRNKISRNNAKYWKGKKLPIAAKKKISITNKVVIKKLWQNLQYRKMMSKALKGKKISFAQRTKISKSLTGRKITWKNKISKTLLGHIVPKKVRQKISFANKGKKRSNISKIRQSDSIKGKNHYNWQGGKSFEPYGIEFNKNLKEQIRTRDQYRCQECFRHQEEIRDKNNKPYKLMIHHIDYNKKNNNPENLVSLCRPCHSQTNYKRKNWTKYFMEKIQHDK